MLTYNNEKFTFPIEFPGFGSKISERENIQYQPLARARYRSNARLARALHVREIQSIVPELNSPLARQFTDILFDCEFAIVTLSPENLDMRFIVFTFMLLAWAAAAPLRSEDEAMKKEGRTTPLEEWFADLEIRFLVSVSVLVVLVLVWSMLIALCCHGRLRSARRADVGTGLPEDWISGLVEVVESSRGLHRDWTVTDQQACSVPALDLSLLEEVERPADSEDLTVRWVAPEHWHYASVPESPPFARSGRLTARKPTPEDLVISIVSAPEFTESRPEDSEILLSVELACLSAPQWVAPEY